MTKKTEQKKTEEQSTEDESTEEQSTEESTEETEAGEESTEETEESTEEEGTEEEASEEVEEGEELDLDRAKDKISKANAEAKNLRNRLRDAEEKLTNAKTPEEVEEIVKQIQSDRETAEADLLRENVALKFNLPEKLQKRLSGETREDMEADAKELAEMFDVDEDEDLSLEGGLNPRGRGDESSDPRSLANQYGSRRKRR